MYLSLTSSKININSFCCPSFIYKGFEKGDSFFTGTIQIRFKQCKQYSMGRGENYLILNDPIPSFIYNFINKYDIYIEIADALNLIFNVCHI
jgi:hypothetical protein